MAEMFNVNVTGFYRGTPNPISNKIFFNWKNARENAGIYLARAEDFYGKETEYKYYEQKDEYGRVVNHTECHVFSKDDGEELFVVQFIAQFIVDRRTEPDSNCPHADQQWNKILEIADKVDQEKSMR